MTISNITNSIQYTISDPSQTTYLYNFKVDYSEDLEIWYRTSATASTDHQMTLNTHYSVLDLEQSSGGRFTLTTAGKALLGIGYELKAMRIVPLTQLTDYIENSSFPAEAHENALDKLTMITQQINADNEQNLWVDEKFIDYNTTKVQRAAGGYLRWDTSGIGIIATYLTTTLFEVSEYYKTQLPLSTAASARAGLGMGDYEYVAKLNKSATFASAMTFSAYTIFSSGVTCGGVSKISNLYGTTCGTFTNGIFLDGLTNTIIGYNNATLGRYTNYASFQLMKGSSSSFTLAKGTNSSYGTAHINHLTLACSPVIPAADADNEAMQFGQRHNSHYLGRITGLEYNYVGGSTYQIKPGYIQIATKMYNSTTSYIKSTLAVSGRIYLYVVSGAAATLTSSSFVASTTVPTFHVWYRGYYMPGDTTKRFYGSLYNTGVSIIKPFFMVDNDIYYTTPATIWDTTLTTPMSIKSTTISNFGPLIPNVRVYAAMRGHSYNSATQGVALHIGQSSESYTYTTIWYYASDSEKWDTAITLGALYRSSRYDCYADNSGLIKLFYASRGTGAATFWQTAWTHPTGVKRT